MNLVSELKNLASSIEKVIYLCALSMSFSSYNINARAVKEALSYIES
jgi:hypothetical protein